MERFADPPEANDEAPEAEWGFDPALHDDLAALARVRGWLLVEIPGVAHTLVFTAPDQLAAVTCQFLLG